LAPAKKDEVEEEEGRPLVEAPSAAAAAAPTADDACAATIGRAVEGAGAVACLLAAGTARWGAKTPAGDD
jgi:hypothetical protein